MAFKRMLDSFELPYVMAIIRLRTSAALQTI